MSTKTTIHLFVFTRLPFKKYQNSRFLCTTFDLDYIINKAVEAVSLIKHKNKGTHNRIRMLLNIKPQWSHTKMLSGFLYL